jgi:phosphate-selective porin OprO and OprP
VASGNWWRKIELVVAAGIALAIVGPAFAGAEDAPVPAVDRQQTQEAQPGTKGPDAAQAQAPPAPAGTSVEPAQAEPQPAPEKPQPAKPQPAPVKPQTQVDASKGGVTIRSGDNSLTFGAYVQIRGVLDDREDYDADAKDTLGYGRADGPMASFDVAKVRVFLRGTMFRPWVKYNLMFEAGRTSGDSSSKIKDAYLELGKDVLSIRAGQYKVPFGLQELTPDTSQELVDRSLANAAFSPSRDMGVMLTGVALERKLGYALGAFNGSGESKVQNNDALMWVARAWFDPLGEYKLSEGAADAPAKHVLHVGAAVRGGDAMKGGKAGIVQDTNGQTAVGLELAWKWQRLFLTAEGFWQRDDVSNPKPGPHVDGLGFHVQGGVMVLVQRLELCARYAQVDPNRDASGDKATELRGGANYYWKGHNLKLQADAGLLGYEPKASGRGTRLADAADEKLQDFQLRLQLQLSF